MFCGVLERGQIILSTRASGNQFSTHLKCTLTQTHVHMHMHHTHTVKGNPEFHGPWLPFLSRNYSSAHSPTNHSTLPEALPALDSWASCLWPHLLLPLLSSSAHDTWEFHKPHSPLSLK